MEGSAVAQAMRFRMCCFMPEREMHTCSKASDRLLYLFDISSMGHSGLYINIKNFPPYTLWISPEWALVFTTACLGNGNAV